MGKILGEVPDGGYPRIERMDGIGSGGGEADHKIAHVGLDGDALTDLIPIFSGLEHRTCFRRNALTKRFR